MNLIVSPLFVTCLGEVIYRVRLASLSAFQTGGRGEAPGKPMLLSWRAPWCAEKTVLQSGKTSTLSRTLQIRTRFVSELIPRTRQPRNHRLSGSAAADRTRRFHPATP